METLRIGEIDYGKKPVKPELFLCKKSKTTIKKLTEAYEIKYGEKLDALNELSFKIPAKIEKNHVLIENENIKTIKHRYLFKLKLNNYVEYFLYNEVQKSGSEDTNEVEYHAFSLGYELNDRIIRSYSEISKPCSEHLRNILSETNWEVGYIDSEFDLKYRTYEVSSQTVLQCVTELAEKYNAVIKWDTVNRKINFFLPGNVGVNRGLKLNYNKYLKSINQAENSEEVITRLKLYGKDELSIRDISPTGQNYLEDFSYYMYPFQRDENRNVIEHSYYMSDELCHQLLDYRELVESKEGEFNSYLQQKKDLESELATKENELSNLNMEMQQILDSLDVANATGNVNGEYHDDLVDKKNQKQNEIDAKQSEIDEVQNAINEVVNNITNLRETIKTEANFTQEALIELNDYIIEKEYVNDSIVDEEDLLNEGLEAFKTYKEPKISINIDIVNFLDIVECQNDWDKLVLGDIITIRVDELDLYTQAKIIEINYDFENSSISLTIANEKAIDDNLNAYMNMLYTSYNAATVVNMEKFKWDLSLENNGMINQIINDIWDANKRAIEGGSEQLISFSNRGIIVKSITDPNTWLVIQNGILAITNDGGDTWKHAITSEGIVGERLYGKIIMGVNLAIEDIDGIIKFRGSKGQIFDRNGNEVMRLGLVSDPPDEDCFGLKLDNGKHQIFVDTLNGFKINKKQFGEWVPVMYADLDGNFWVKDFKAKNLTIEDDDGYFKFQGNKATVSDGFKDVMWLGYLADEGNDFGIIVKNDVNDIYMTRNRGFEITRDGVTKFKADLDGGLYAEDITTKNIKIIDGELGEGIEFDQITGITITGQHGEKIYLNANEGIKIEVNGDKRFWIDTDGTLRAKKLIITPDNEEQLVELPDGSFISELTVNSLRSLNSVNPQDHVYIKDNFIKLVTGIGDATDVPKFTLALESSGGSSYPKMTWGAGGLTGGTDIGYIYKDNNGFYWQYVGEDGQTRKINLNDTVSDSILIQSPHNIRVAGNVVRIEVDSNNYIEISNTGVKIRGTRIDLN